MGITLESIQEERDTLLVEYQNQQKISRCVISHIRLTTPQHQLYTEWEIHASCERRTLVKSNNSELLGEFGELNITLWQTINVIFLLLKLTSTKHL